MASGLTRIVMYSSSVSMTEIVGLKQNKNKNKN